MTSSFTPNIEHPGEGLLVLSIWSWEGQVQSCGLLSHSWLQIRVLPQWPHHHRFSPKPLFGVFPSHKQGLGHDREVGVLQLLEEGLCPFLEG